MVQGLRMVMAASLALGLCLMTSACGGPKCLDCESGGTGGSSGGQGGSSGNGGNGGTGGDGGTAGNGAGSGCEARPAADGQCGGANPPHHYACTNFEPSEPAAGCMLFGIGDLYDFYCCP